MENFILIILLTIACKNFKKHGKYFLYVLKHFGTQIVWNIFLRDLPNSLLKQNEMWYLSLI